LKILIQKKSFGVITNVFTSLRDNPIISDTLWVTTLSTIAKGVGFLIPFFIAAWFGICPETDAFFFAYGLVLYLAGVLAPVVESVIVPFIAEIKAKGDVEVKTFLGTTLVLLTVATVLLAGFFLIISKPLLTFVTCFSKESLNLIFWLLVEIMPLLVLLIATSLLAGTLNSLKLFSLPAISPALRAVPTLFFAFHLKDKIGIHSIAIGYVIGELFRLSFLTVQAIRKDVFSLNNTFFIYSSPIFLKFIKTSSYLVIGMIIIAFNPIVDKTMASWLGPGSVSLLEYAERLYQIPLTLVGSGFLVVILSHWSDSFFQDNDKVFRQKVITATKIAGIIAFLITFLLLFLNYPLVNFVYGYGKLSVHHLNLVSGIWMCYLIGFVPTILGFLFSRAHLAKKNTKLLMAIGISNFILNISFNFIFIGPFGISGLALSTTITHFILAFVLYYFLVKPKIVFN